MRRRTALSFVLCALLTACSGDRAPAPGPGPGAPRIVTLAPHLAELVVTAGGEQHLVGVSAYTDYPPSLTALPVVSDGFRVDAEALLAARPDLVLIWGGGGQQAAVELTGRLGLRAVVIDTSSLADVAPALRRIGTLIGSSAVADAAAADFSARIAALGFDGRRLDVFYQIGERPLYTVNGEHFISELIERCGGRNVFASLGTLAPAVSVESVVRADPDVILRARSDAGDGAGEAGLWRRWPDMAVNRSGNHLVVEADLVARPSTRLAAGGRAICAALARARMSAG